jgi:16S rRNA G1207 methylase RsmC
MLTPQQLHALRQPIQFQADLGGVSLQLQSTWGLFSPREIDSGSRLLLDYAQIAPTADCFDLGCGYGVIGLCLAARAPQGQTVMVDKDSVAVDYSYKNIKLNGLQNAEVILSNGFAQIDRQRRFDVIASNLPAKVGKELLTLFLYDAYHHLRPDGVFYVVTINGLRQFMKRYMEGIFHNYEKLKQSSHYTVALARR